MSDTDEHINVEELIAQIRRQILEKHAALGDEAMAHIPVSGKHLPPEFYNQLYLAGLAQNQLQVHEQVQESGLPLLGPIVDRIKYALHRLVIFYVNRMAMRQESVNMHVLRALSILTEELEREQDPGT